MMYMIMTILLLSGGFILFLMTKMIPILQYAFMDWIAIILLAVPTILLLYSIISRRLLWLIEKIPRNKMLMLFIRRDGDIVPVLGSRAYPGESFIDVPRLGLLHDLGVVCRWGSNHVRFSLENVNHTVDPRYVNFTSWLYDLGFNSINEVRACINGGTPQAVEKQREILENLPRLSVEPVEQLKNELVQAEDEPIKPKHEEVTNIIDKLIRRSEGV